MITLELQFSSYSLALFLASIPALAASIPTFIFAAHHLSSYPVSLALAFFHLFTFITLLSSSLHLIPRTVFVIGVLNGVMTLCTGILGLVWFGGDMRKASLDLQLELACLILWFITVMTSTSVTTYVVFDTMFFSSGSIKIEKRYHHHKDSSLSTAPFILPTPQIRPRDQTRVVSDQTLHDHRKTISTSEKDFMVFGGPLQYPLTHSSKSQFKPSIRIHHQSDSTTLATVRSTQTVERHSLVPASDNDHTEQLIPSTQYTALSPAPPPASSATTTPKKYAALTTSPHTPTPRRHSNTALLKSVISSGTRRVSQTLHLPHKSLTFTNSPKSASTNTRQMEEVSPKLQVYTAFDEWDLASHRDRLLTSPAPPTHPGSEAGSDHTAKLRSAGFELSRTPMLDSTEDEENATAVILDDKLRQMYPGKHAITASLTNEFAVSNPNLTTVEWNGYNMGSSYHEETTRVDKHSFNKVRNNSDEHELETPASAISAFSFGPTDEEMINVQRKRLEKITDHTWNQKRAGRIVSV